MSGRVESEGRTTEGKGEGGRKTVGFEYEQGDGFPGVGSGVVPELRRKIRGGEGERDRGRLEEDKIGSEVYSAPFLARLGGSGGRRVEESKYLQSASWLPEQR